jgi:DNA-binding ferritin-like protein
MRPEQTQPEQTEKDATLEQQTARTAQPVDDTGDEQHERLVPEDHAASYGSRWDAVKGTFVDEPREAVAQADALVGELLDELETLFREQRHRIEEGLDSDDTSTEDLRLALRRYRSFFDRLLAV